MPGEISRSYDGSRDLPDQQVVLTCVYCGHAYPPGTPAAMHPLLTEHIAQCPAHPMRAVVEQRDALLCVLTDFYCELCTSGRVSNATLERVRTAPGMDESLEAAIAKVKGTP